MNIFRNLKHLQMLLKHSKKEHEQKASSSANKRKLFCIVFDYFKKIQTAELMSYQSVRQYEELPHILSG